MIQMMNKLLYFLKYILYIVSFAFTFYVVVFLYQRLDKDIMEIIPVFLPFFLLLLCFSINMIGNQIIVKNNFFYNFLCCFVFSLIIYVGCRSLFDPYMVSRIRLGYDINFNYFSDMISPLQVMLYGLSITNLLLMATKKKQYKKDIIVKITEKVEV